jgi:hypothetical protein
MNELSLSRFLRQIGWTHQIEVDSIDSLPSTSVSNNKTLEVSRCAYAYRSIALFRFRDGDSFDQDRKAFTDICLFDQKRRKPIFKILASDGLGFEQDEEQAHDHCGFHRNAAYEKGF